MLSKKLNKLIILLAVTLSLAFLLSVSCAEAASTSDQGLKDKVTSLQNQLAESLPYIIIEELTDEYYTLKLATQDADFPVVITLYGSGLTAGVVKPASTDYNITNEYLHNSHLLTVVVEPFIMWRNGNTIKINLKDFYSVGGIVSYATANCGS